jgi:hypothetical protein
MRRCMCWQRVPRQGRALHLGQLLATGWTLPDENQSTAMPANWHHRAQPCRQGEQEALPGSIASRPQTAGNGRFVSLSAFNSTINAQGATGGRTAREAIIHCSPAGKGQECLSAILIFCAVFASGASLDEPSMNGSLSQM